jgi:mycothiol synthase
MDNSIINPAPPSLAGLVWRPITHDDLATLVQIAVDCQAADGGLAFLNQPSDLLSRCFPDAPGAAIGAFAAEAQLVAYGAVHLLRKSDTERAEIVGQVRPEQRNRGLGTYLMRWSQAHAQALFAAAAGDRRLLQIATESLTEPANRLYLAHGFERVYESLVMSRDLRQPLLDRPLPSDVTITSWQPDLANQFFQAYEAAFHERPGFPGYSAAEWIFDWNDNENARNEWSLLARAGDVPVGFVLARAEHPGGFVAQVGVVPGQRRRGLGSALLVETMRRMQAGGKPAAQLNVNLNNPGAIQTYLSLGFVSAGSRARYERAAD